MVALRLVHGMLVRDVPPLPPGIKAVAMIIAPRSNMRDEVFAYALGAIEQAGLRRNALVSTKARTFRSASGRQTLVLPLWGAALPPLAVQLRVVDGFSTSRFR